jgi:hypothetical protein
MFYYFCKNESFAGRHVFSTDLCSFFNNAIRFWFVVKVSKVNI